MDYKKIEDKYYLRLDKKDEVMASITEFCKKEGIKTAYFQGIGACDKVICQTLNLETHNFASHEKTGMLEMLSLLGNVALDDNNNLSLHAHASFSYVEDGEVKLFGGHLKEAYICYTGEIIITPAEEPILRSTKTGMNIWSFKN